MIANSWSRKAEHRLEAAPCLRKVGKLVLHLQKHWGCASRHRAQKQQQKMQKQRRGRTMALQRYAEPSELLGGANFNDTLGKLSCATARTTPASA